jgi:alkanesulfonate monooxygenase SsuD/methylene tetrahydromethanopterin reductase-like flavin-dependent oxidoreductase (luciferase family)
VRDRIPVMLGGSGENKTFRLAARFADHVRRTG